MGGGGDAEAPAAATPATTEDAPASSAPAKAEASAAPAPVAPAAPEPTPPWVEAAQSRKKIPVWAVPVLALLPIWAVVYALTLDPPTEATGPLTIGRGGLLRQGVLRLPRRLRRRQRQHPRPHR